MSNLPPVHDFNQTISWLASEGLTQPEGSMVTTSLDVDFGLFAQPVKGRFERLKQAQLDELRKQRKDKSTVSPEAAFDEARRIKAGLIQLDWTRYPSDAIAFYRPFHFSRLDEWGIYFDVEKLLNYVHQVFGEMRGQVASFDFESLLTACLCEVFQHEYFHHISECAATTLEVMFHHAGRPRSVYIDYWRNRFHSNHRHSPLEEALANAYAYNSLTFLSRVKMGLRTTRVSVYQAALRQHWRKEPPGYRDAAHYIDGGYVPGAGELVRLFIPNDDSPPFALELVAKEVLLNGNATFFAKPDIPVYICGSEASVEEFNKHVPAPVEAYSSLTWLDDSSQVDAYFEAKRQEKRRGQGGA